MEERRSPDIEFTDEAEAYRLALDLVNRLRYMVLGLHGDEFPLLRAVTKVGNHDLRRIWFCTKKDSRKVAVLRAEPRASIYFLDTKSKEGLMLHGKVEIVEGVQVGYTGPEADSEESLVRRLESRGMTLGCALHPGYVVGVFHSEGANYSRRGTIADIDLSFEPAQAKGGDSAGDKPDAAG